MLDEQEVGGLAGAGVWQGALGAALRCPSVQRVEGRLVQGDGAFGAELAQWDLQPAAVTGEVEQAVQLEVEQFAQAQPGAAQDGQAVAGERV